MKKYTMGETCSLKIIVIFSSCWFIHVKRNISMHFYGPSLWIKKVQRDVDGLGITV